MNTEERQRMVQSRVRQAAQNSQMEVMFISHQTADQSLTSVCVCVCSLSVCQHLCLSLSGCCLHADMLSPLFLSSGKDMQFDFDIILKPGL